MFRLYTQLQNLKLIDLRAERCSFPTSLIGWCSQKRTNGISDMTPAGDAHTGKWILSVGKLTKQFGNDTIFNKLTFEIRGRDRVWLLGKNGTGKTTLLNIITDRIKSTAGIARIGVNVHWGYFQQNQRHLPKQMTVGEYLKHEANLYHYRAFQFLTKFNFRPDYVDRKLGTLSPGEQARLSFALFTHGEYTFLILDEPVK